MTVSSNRILLSALYGGKLHHTSPQPCSAVGILRAQQQNAAPRDAAERCFDRFVDLGAKQERLDARDAHGHGCCCLQRWCAWFCDVAPTKIDAVGWAKAASCARSA